MTWKKFEIYLLVFIFCSVMFPQRKSSQDVFHGWAFIFCKGYSALWWQSQKTIASTLLMFLFLNKSSNFVGNSLSIITDVVFSNGPHFTSLVVQRYLYLYFSKWLLIHKI